MTDAEFRKLVVAMRQAQRYFFASPPGPDKKRWLGEARRLEKRVDDELRSDESQGQRSMF